jgi:hypothetical protein
VSGSPWSHKLNPSNIFNQCNVLLYVGMLECVYSVALQGILDKFCKTSKMDVPIMIGQLEHLLMHCSVESVSLAAICTQSFQF